MVAATVAASAPATSRGQDTPDYFRQNCASCHTIGGIRLTGPDLKDVGKRRDPAWLINFMMNPRAVIDGGDAYAQDLWRKSKEVYMPTAPGMTRERAEKLLALIEAESKLEESNFKGVQISTAPFTDADRKFGRNIFLGYQSLKEGGPSCISCHSTHGIAALGGGRLGPDLTNVFGRLQGRATLSAWLIAPATETMQPIFKSRPMSSAEIHALAAYFESTAAERPANASVNRVAFLLLGLAGAAAFVFLFDAIWKRRFHAVRRPLVESLPSRGEV